MKTKRLLGAAIVGVIAFSSLAFATIKHTKHSEVPALKAQMAAAKISFNDAITAAEAHVQGKATQANLEDEMDKFAYKVEVLKGDQFTDVTVDSRDGKILLAVADKGEREGDREDKDR